MIFYGRETALHAACRSSEDTAENVEAFINDERCTSEIINQKDERYSKEVWNQTDKNGDTALIVAIKHGKEDVVKLLVHSSKNDCTVGNPLLYCVENNLPNMVSILLAKENPKVPIEFPQTDQNSGLIKACADNYLEVVKILLKDERLTNEHLLLKNGKGETALMVGVINANVEVVSEFVSNHGWQDDCKNENGQNAFDIAKDRKAKYDAIVDLKN